MPRFDLQMAVEEQENVELDVELVEEWHMRIQCSNCRTVHPAPVYLRPGVLVRAVCHALAAASAHVGAAQIDIPGSRGQAHLVMKCKGCERHGSIEIVPKKGAATRVSANDTWTTVLSLECRGFEPTELDLAATRTVRAVGTTGTVFADLEWDGADWADYDDDANLSVSLMGVRSQFVRG